MLKKTIAKFSGFVIPIAFAGVLATACGHASGDRARAEFDRAQSPFDPPQIVGNIESNEITESSGIAVSRCQPDVFWTHNDSGDDAFIFAFNSKGKHLGTWRVDAAQNKDWEDIDAFMDPSGGCYVLIGDIGNNQKDKNELKVYRIKEPAVTPADSASNKKNPLATAPAESLAFRFPDSPPDAETMAVHPRTGEIYVLSKTVNSPSSVYRLRPDFGATQVQIAEKIANLAVPAVPNGLLTGGEISPDGTRVVVCDYTAAYELTLPSGTTAFDEIWKQKPAKFDIGDRKMGEAVAYGMDGNSVWATSEKKNSPLFRAQRKAPGN